MTIYNYAGSHSGSLEWAFQRVRPGGVVDGITRTSNSSYSYYDFRDIQRNDPMGRFYHGNYTREMIDLAHLPQVSGTLRYESKTTPKTYYTTTLNGQGWGFVIPRSRWLYEDENHRAQLINNCIKGAMEQSVDLATFIAELDKTGDLLAEQANRIARAAGEIRKGQFSRAARTLKIQKPKRASRSKSFSNNLLEYQYGWMPIVTDMAGMMQHLIKLGRGLVIKSRSRITTSVPLSDTRQVELEKHAQSQHRYIVTWRAESTWYRHEQVQLLFWLNSGFWDQLNRLGFLNPGQIAYQTIPGSFLLEWFTNLGDVIGSLSLGLTLDYATGSYVEFHQNDGELKGSAAWFDTVPGTYKYTEVSASVIPTFLRDVRIRRSVILESEVATQFVLNAPLSLNKAITATALVRQAL